MNTKIMMVCGPTPKQRKGGAEVVFIRQDTRTRQEHVICACKVYEGWEQWGAPREVLADNVPTVEEWRRGLRGSYE